MCRRPICAPRVILRIGLTNFRVLPKFFTLNHTLRLNKPLLLICDLTISGSHLWLFTQAPCECIPRRRSHPQRQTTLHFCDQDRFSRSLRPPSKPGTSARQLAVLGR